jgi:signal transduction histidine kinase
MKARAITAKVTHISIDWIANRISLWALVATTLSVLIFTCTAIFTQIKEAYRGESDRLAVVAPAVARALAGELLIGDEKSIDMLMTDLQRQFDLDKLMLVSGPAACKQEVSGLWDRWSAVCDVIPLSEIGTTSFLLISSRVKTISWFGGLSSVLWVCIPLILFGIYSSIRLRRELERSITKPIKELADNPEHWEGSDKWVAQEAVVLHQQLQRYINERDSERDQAASLKLEASIGQIAAQVAHDIRSPLAALDMLASDLKPLPEEKRVLLRSAVARIRDITNNLVDKQKTKFSNLEAAGSQDCATGSVIDTELISSLIEALVSEKRIQYRSRIGLQIESPLTRRSYGLFAEVQPSEFKRVLSNLIDNAAQAISGPGRITVELESEAQSVVIRVIDTGKGIPAGVLPRLAQKGASFFKAGGTGLGLFHAKNCVESWNGKLSINSSEGEGTTVEIRLPRAPVPNWFVPELALSGVQNIVILDDDTSIHYIWRGRFESSRVRDRQISILHFSNEAQIRDWCKDHISLLPTTLFLIDYELSEGRKTGLGSFAASASTETRFSSRAVSKRTSSAAPAAPST